MAATEASEDRGALIYRYYERLYRVALLVAGDAGSAVTLVEQAYVGPSVAGDPEAALIRELAGAVLARRAVSRPWTYAVGDALLARAGLDRAQTDALLQALASLAPSARLIAGLHYLRGLPAPEIDALLDGAVPGGASSALATLRIELARTLDLLPALVGDEVLRVLDRYAAGGMAAPDAAELRTRLNVYDELRAARAGLARAHELLARTLPALFAVAPPPELPDQLLAAPALERPRLPQLTWAHAGLIAAVAAIIAAILIVPPLLNRSAATSAPGPRTAGELIDASIYRLERPPLDAGVLHEVYQAHWSDQPAYLIERWYEYAAPHRFSVAVRIVGDSRPLLTIASDGRGLVQYRAVNNTSFGAQMNGALDVHVSPAELAAALPVLRQLPSPGVYSSGPLAEADISRFFLAAAHASRVTFLGTTIFVRRPAYLVAYHTMEPLPPPLSAIFLDPLPPPPSPHQVLLTIDQETYGLLDVAVLPEAAAQATPQHPWQAQSVAVVAETSDSVFSLPREPGLAQRNGLPSPRDFGVSGDQARAPSAMTSLLRQPLLIPQTLPDPTMRGLLLAADPAPVDPAGLRLVYDGAFVSMALLPVSGANDVEQTKLQTAGAFRYYLLASGVKNSPLIGAIVTPIAEPRQQVMVLLMDEYATPEERQATLRTVIASLAPLTAQNAAAIEQHFYRP